MEMYCLWAIVSMQMAISANVYIITLFFSIKLSVYCLLVRLRHKVFTLRYINLNKKLWNLHFFHFKEILRSILGGLLTSLLILTKSIVSKTISCSYLYIVYISIFISFTF